MHVYYYNIIAYRAYINSSAVLHLLSTTYIITRGYTMQLRNYDIAISLFDLYAHTHTQTHTHTRTQYLVSCMTGL